MVPPWDLVPYVNCGGTDFVHDIVHIAQTGPQGHFSVGPQRGRFALIDVYEMLHRIYLLWKYVSIHRGEDVGYSWILRVKGLKQQGLRSQNVK